jgi:uncharacterized membrane protein YGL010W
LRGSWAPCAERFPTYDTPIMILPRPRHTLREYVGLYEKEHTQFGTKLTHMVGIPMIVFSIPAVFVNPALAGGLFAGGWALQYIGHYAFEHNKPAFYGDPYYLLVGPAWVAVEWMRLFGLPVPDALAPVYGDVTHVNGESVATA